MLIKLLIILLFINKITNRIPTIQETHKSLIGETAALKETIFKNANFSKQNDTEIGYLNIPKINLKEPLYDTTNEENNIEKNITILKASNNPFQKESLIILAAHSGTGKIAYFNNLNDLDIHDEVNLSYYNENYTYIVTDIYNQDKNGYINIPKKDFSQLILTTCNKEGKNKQLIVECKIKES